jgi:catechol 2,3-dioxygenase-like lactoylglutathione lyase family enzyme
MTLPRALSHVGITVPDIDAATAWYRDVLGCYVLAHPSDASDDGSNFGNVVKDIFGKEFGGLKIAHLSTADGVGIELFQFIKPETYVPGDTFDYRRTGIFHICITAADIETTAAEIEANGGQLMSKIWRLFSNKDYKACYCRDPWGTVIELNSHSYGQTWSNLEEPHKL